LARVAVEVPQAQVQFRGINRLRPSLGELWRKFPRVLSIHRRAVFHPPEMSDRTAFLFTTILLISTGSLLVAHQASSHPNAKKEETVKESVQAHDSEVRGAPAGPDVLAQGKAEFLARCSFCHAPDATGASGPDLTRSLLVRRDVNGNLIGPVILNGRPEKGMPAFRLSDAQIADIVAFLHTRANEELFSFGMPKNYSFHTGDAKKGKAFFFGNGHCSSCHSPEGDLKGIASKYPPLTLMAFIAYPDGTADRTATVMTASGKTISGQLVHLDEFTVSIRDAAGWVHTWDRGAVKVNVHDPLAEHRRLLMNYTDAELHNLFAYLETLK
jgi:cytochrome c oxidase cbb3-type subunit III